MDVIPVIDLKQGQVVHAQRGQRDSYRPIETPLSPTSRPEDVLAGLLRLHRFRWLYIADLDAIEGRGSHADQVAALAAAFPDVEIWLDAGVRDRDAARAWLDRDAGCLVLGSESQDSADLLREFRNESRVVLSLDFRGDSFQGPAEILNDVSLWPRRVLVMTLARVGAGEGPDLVKLGDIASRAEGRLVYASGGVRSADDLRAAREVGAAGALVATSLHQGTISQADLENTSEV